jgi:Ca-activated chloride channel family protein
VKFANPWWLAAALIACAMLLWMWRVADARQRTALARFVAAHLHPQLTRSISMAKRRLQRGLFLAAVVLLCVALAGPLLGFRWERINRRGNEIVFAIDTSRSMSTPDIKPDRLTRAKLAIDDFAHQLDGDAVGIVAFAGSAFLVCPITLDYGAFHESLGAIDTNTIPRGGTNISSAIHEAQVALRRRPGSDRILILVTDGEDLEGSALAAAQAAAQEDGLKIYTVGVGSASGDLIPIPPEQGGGFVKDDTGAFVKSRLDETALKAIATATGGLYVPLGTQGEGLDTIFKTVLGPLAKHDLASRQQRIYIERYQWPLAASLLALLASLLIGTRRRGSARKPRNPRSTVALSLLLLIDLAAHAPRTAAAGAGAESGGSPTAGGATAGLATAGTASTGTAPLDPKAPVLEFNAGTAAYRAGQFPQAAQAFQQSINHAPSSDPQRLADQEDAYYNLGNTLYRAGQKTEDSAPQDTIQQWTDAVKAYETALQLRADDADSKFNRDLVKRKIDALKQKQNQQNKNQNQGQGQGQGNGQGQGKGQGQGQNQQQNGQPPQGQPPQGQPPQGQPPQGQPPQGQPPQNQQSQGQPQNAKNNDQKQGAPPPQPNPGTKGDQPPQSAGQPPTPANGEPQRGDAAGGDPDQRAADEAADNQHLPGQMSREEARELLDSVKGDERHALGAPMARSDVDDTPDKPIKNW